MKKQKLAVVFAALLTMVGFSSCLNGETDPTVSPKEFMKVNGGVGYYSFTSSLGYTITPANMSALKDVQLSTSYAYVIYSYDSSLMELNEDKSATINAVVGIRDGWAMPRATVEEDGNAPIYSLQNNTELIYYGYPAYLAYYDKYNLFIPITYYYDSSEKSGEDSEESGADIDTHSFALYYDSEEASDKGTLLMHLRHKVINPDTKRDKTNTESVHFNIAAVLSAYTAKTGISMPDKIVIEYEESQTSSYDNTTSNKLEFEYKSVFEENIANN